MSLHVQRYGIEDFNRLMYEGFDYELDTNVREIIQALSDQVGAPEYIRTPQFPKTNKRYDPLNAASKGVSGSGRRARYGQGNSTSDDDWNSFRQFQPTKLVKKEGVEKTIDTIRKYLNKISDKNYTNQRDNIFQDLKELQGNDCDDVSDNVSDNVHDEFDKVVGAIFSIASGNMFYSKLYAQLYKEMMEEFPSMNTMFKNNLVKFRDIFKTIEYCDSEKDYDKFCAVNKENEKRRATGMFYVNLMKLDVVSREEIVTIIKEIHEYQMSKIVEEGNKHVVDELSEVISIMMMNAISYFTGEQASSEWNSIVTSMEKVAAMKVAHHPSITSKSIFKHMDIVDEIKKHKLVK